MTLSAESTVADADPITFEVIRHRLLGIVDEQAARLSAISGSKNVTEMSDFNVGIYLPDGAVAVMGRTILFHASSMSSMVHHVIEDCAGNPGIGPGDMFVVNNPWKGALHGPDMAIVAPIFAGGELIFWSGGLMHMADIGGMREGGIGLDATDCYQEGLLLPPVKLVENGVIRSDIWNLIVSHSRAEFAMSLDLKGLMAANHAAAEGMGKLVERYGVPVLRSIMARLIEISEERMHRRLSELPDATIETIGYLEYNEALKEAPRVALTLTKSGDRLVLDYSATSEQTPDAKNCTWAGLMAGISAALLPTIAYDIPWNAGLFRALEVICPEGRLCNARKPAAVSGNIAGAVFEVQLATVGAISRLLACSDQYLGEAEAGPPGRPAVTVFHGVKADGQRVVGFTLDNLASGGAAYRDHDGVAVQGHHDIERTKISNVESLELDYPLLYLWRGLAADSGGAGRHRGGLSVGSIYAPHKAQRFFVPGLQRFEIPDSSGIFGGLVGAQNQQVLVRESDVRRRFAAGQIPDFEELAGEYVSTADLPRSVALSEHEVLKTISETGGGWGDPLEREPGVVQADLDAGAITREAAERLYGVELTSDDRVDVVATRERQEAIRAARRALPVREAAGDAPAGGPLARVCPLGDRLEVVTDPDGQAWTRCTCGHLLGPATENWRGYAASDAADPADIAVTLIVHASMEFRRYYCPGCGLQHSVDLVPKGAADPRDVRLHLSDIRSGQ
jgi:N-methylhydantoinase B